MGMKHFLGDENEVSMPRSIDRELHFDLKTSQVFAVNC